MNVQTIDRARDADLRLSVVAMQRAAQRARELATQTGTAIVVSHQGRLQTIDPPKDPARQPFAVREPVPPYNDKP